jgi:hypothetical protein
MTIKHATRGSVCIAALLAGSTAMADVTAQEVWDDFKASMSIYSAEQLSIGSETMSGDTLTVSDIAINVSEEEVAVTATLSEILFIEQGDGTVLVDMSDEIPITIVNTPRYGAPSTVNAAIRQQNEKFVVDGSAGNFEYTLTTDSYAFVIDEIIEADGPAITGDMAISLNDIDLNYQITGGELRNTASQGTIGNININFDMSEPGGSGHIAVKGDINDMTLNGTSSVPMNYAVIQPEDIFTSGLAFKSASTTSSTSMSLDMDVDGIQAKGSLSLGATEGNILFNAQELAYSGSADALALALEGSEVPFPVEISMAEYGLGFAMPLAKTKDPANFGMNVSLVDLAVNDMIWMIADPTGALPHDPATLTFDVTGMAKMLFNVLDPADQQAMAMADMPAELYSLNLDNLKLAIAGALLTGEGAFTFDNANLSPQFGGMPQPTGTLNVNLDGANGLMDKLVQMGLLPEDQVMGARMMMGMFANTVGDDQLESKLEVNAEGHVIVNGQRIQ